MIRFKNNADTLPRVLDALAHQTTPVQRIIAVDTGSSDESPQILQKFGAEIVAWAQPYHHARVLNFALEMVETERVLILSSHTVMDDPSTLQRFHAALDDERIAAVSVAWKGMDISSEPLDFAQIQETQLRFGSIYTNSLGMLTHHWWKRFPFEERLNGVEDYYFALQ